MQCPVRGRRLIIVNDIDNTIRSCEVDINIKSIWDCHPNKQLNRSRNFGQDRGFGVEGNGLKFFPKTNITPLIRLQCMILVVLTLTCCKHKKNILRSSKLKAAL